MRKVLSMLVPVFATVAVTGPLHAQTTSYYTQGYFSGFFAPCNNPAPLANGTPTNAECSGAGLTVDYFATTGTAVVNGATATLGTIELSGQGVEDVPAGLAFLNLIVNQTNPSTGASTFVGSISGSISTGAGGVNTLIWAPNQSINLGGVNYTLVFDSSVPGISGIGIPSGSQTTVRAFVTTATPEPASIALMATGLIGLGGVVRRRKNSEAVA
jgi:hypothetical protein